MGIVSLHSIRKDSLLFINGDVTRDVKSSRPHFVAITSQSIGLTLTQYASD